MVKTHPQVAQRLVSVATGSGRVQARAEMQRLARAAAARRTEQTAREAAHRQAVIDDARRGAPPTPLISHAEEGTA